MFILTEKNIDHFHRIGSSYVDENKGNTCKSLIIKYNSWLSWKNSTMQDHGILKMVRKNQVTDYNFNKVKVAKEHTKKSQCKLLVEIAVLQ